MIELYAKALLVVIVGCLYLGIVVGGIWLIICGRRWWIKAIGIFVLVHFFVINIMVGNI